MIRWRVSSAFILVSVMLSIQLKGIWHSTGGEESVSEADTRILAEIRDHSEALANLEHLSDNIGSRVTGSAQLQKANVWAEELFRRYGLTNVHQEAWTVPRTWKRGAAHARILEPADQPLTIASAGWSPSTAGVVRGPLMYFDARNKEDFAKFHGKLKGAVVIRTQANRITNQSLSAEIFLPMQQPRPRWDEPPLLDSRVAAWQANREQMQFFKEEGVACVLIDSARPHGLLNMGTLEGGYDVNPVPAAFVTAEGYRMLFRLLRHGPVRIEVEITNTLNEGPVLAYNTVAEISGTQKPDEIVILGAHLDSWDLGTGALDDGTGSAAVLEAARALAQLNLRPVRTIRFVLFTGEEQGHYGSLAYVDAHKNELRMISAVLVHDSGTGRVLTLGLQDNYQDREVVDRLLAPLQELNLLEPSMRRLFGSDHLSFDDAGVPGFWTLQEPKDYPVTYHSQADTFDQVSQDELVQGAQVMAGWAYNTAALSNLLPRRPKLANRNQ